MAKQIVRQAPYLRRYARALTGAQSAGDALVQAAMEGLLAAAPHGPVSGAQPSLA
jgi:DNA-directed RNA polymerase specialized sigma24 family protein